MTPRSAKLLSILLGVSLAALAAASGPRNRDDVRTGAGATTTLLPDDRWLLLGGYGPTGPQASAEIWDPNTQLTTPLPVTLQHARAWHTATVLPDGTVLIVGGVGPENQLVTAVERFNPGTGTLDLLADTGVTARAEHTTTLLTDGRVLIVGGVSDTGQTLATAELWSFQTRHTDAVPALRVARRAHNATLQADGSVLIWGGLDSKGRSIAGSELFNPADGFFVPSSVPTPPSAADPPDVSATLPAAGDRNVPSDVIIALRFSKALAVETLTPSTVTLVGPTGLAPAGVVAAESGRLLFVTPSVGLMAGSTYTLRVHGAVDVEGLALPPTEISFETALSFSAVASTPRVSQGPHPGPGSDGHVDHSRRGPDTTGPVKSANSPVSASDSPSGNGPTSAGTASPSSLSPTQVMPQTGQAAPLPSPLPVRQSFLQLAQPPSAVAAAPVTAAAPMTATAPRAALDIWPAPPEIVELARALKYDPDLIYEYVYNTIEYTPIGGQLKGPVGTLLDGRGSDYDQAALMVALLQEAARSNPAISNIQFESGQIRLTASQVLNWFGTDDNIFSIGTILGSGGIPATLWRFADNTIAFVDMQHIWVRVSISGTSYAFDPSFKTYTRRSPINLASAMGYTRASFIADAEAGAVYNTTSIAGINRSNVRNNLQRYAGNLAGFITTNAPAAAMADIVGGRSIVPTPLPVRQANLPNLTPGVTPSDGTAIASSVIPTLALTLPGAQPVTFNAPDIYGHRLSVFFNASNQPVLALDGVTQATGSAQTSGASMAITTTITVPFFTHANQTNRTLTVQVGGAYVIATGWDQVGRGMIEKHRRLLSQAIASGASASSEPVLAESLAIIGYTWLAECAAHQQLSDQLLATTTQYFYGIGIAGYRTGGTTSSPYVDLPFNFVNPPTRINGSSTGVTANTLAAFFDDSGVASVLESGTLEQTQAPVPGFVAASTVKLLDLASQGDTIFDINNSGIPGDDATFYTNTIRPQLVPNYAASDLAQIDGFVNAGYRVITPQHGRIAVGTWTGVGFKAILVQGNAASIGEIISGGLSGGFGGTNVAPPTLDNNVVTTNQQAAAAPTPAAGLNFSTTLTNMANAVGDPIDRVSGAYMYQHDDLTVGSAPFPYGLGFQRTYSSSAQGVSGPLGNGWTHNFAITATVGSDGFEGMGQASPLSAAAAIVALFVSSDLLNGYLVPAQANLDLLVIGVLVNRWLMDQLTNNIVAVSQPSGTEHFTRLADGTTYAAPLGSASVLKNTGGTFSYAGKNGVTLGFDNNGNLTTWAHPAGMTVSLTYSGSQLASVANNAGRALTIAYSGSRIASVSDGTGRSVSYGYNGPGNLTTFSDALQQTTTFAYDTSGVFDTAGHLTQVFYPSHPTLAFVTNFYDSLGRVAQQKDGQGNLTQAFIAGSRTEIVDPVGNRQAFYMDARGNVLKDIQDVGDATHLNITTSYAYDGQARRTLTTLPEGNTVAATYDTLSNPLTITATPKPGSPLAPTIRTFTYTSPVAAQPNFSVPKTSQDPLGNITTYDYDPTTGNLTIITQPPVDGQTPQQRFTYNSRSQILTVTDAVAKVTSYAYDPTTEVLQSVTDDIGVGRLNLVMGFGYDAVGNITRRTDPNGNSTTSQYDALRRVTLVTAPPPLSFTTAYGYDPDGHVTQVQRSVGNGTFQTTQATYSLTGKLSTATDPSGNPTIYTYDADDRLASRQDAENRLTSYTYDALSRPFQVFNTAVQAGALERRSYRPNGQLASLADARGNSTTYDYDGLDRLARVTFPDASVETSGYDANGNLLTTTTRSGATITSTYDALNRRRTKTPQGELAVSYGYDLTGRLTAVADSTGGLTYGYDTAGRTTSVLRSDSLLIHYGYDAAGNRTQLTWPDNYVVTYRYDQLNRLTQVLENGTIPLATYTLDGVSRRTALAYGNGIGVTYGYAGTDVDLTSVAQAFPDSPVSVTYGYNKVHQRSSQNVSDSRFVFHPAAASTLAYTPNAVNEYTAVGGASLSYDGNANLTGDGVSTYAYDTENRLLTATGPGLSASYAYDALGRRRSKTVGGVSTQYLADADREIAEYDGTGTLLLRYVYGPGIDEPVAVVTPDGAHTFTHQDGLGSVIALSTDSSAVTDRYSYGAYGESATLAGTAFRFTGRRLDPETGLYYYRARYYSPALGRFLQTDPVGYEGGLNLYAYVSNDPLNRTDPNGLWAQQVGTATWELIKSGADYASNNPGQVLGVGLIGAGIIACTLSPCVAAELAVGASGAAAAVPAVTAIGAASAASILGGGTILLSESQDPNNAGGSQSSSGSSTPSADPNKLNHIFGNPVHNLSGVVSEFGSHESAFAAIQKATQAAVEARKIEGIFEVQVKVGQRAVTVRGNVIGGVARIGTAFIP